MKLGGGLCGDFNEWNITVTTTLTRIFRVEEELGGPKVLLKNHLTN